MNDGLAAAMASKPTVNAGLSWKTAIDCKSSVAIGYTWMAASRGEVKNVLHVSSGEVKTVHVWELVTNTNARAKHPSLYTFRAAASSNESIVLIHNLSGSGLSVIVVWR